MRKRPSERNYAILAHRQNGNSIEATAKMFGLSAGRTRKIELQTRDYAEAHELLKEDPDNLLLLARTGNFILSAAHALSRVEIHRVQDVMGASFRDLLMLPGMGWAGVERIVKL